MQILTFDEYKGMFATELEDNQDERYYSQYLDCKFNNYAYDMTDLLQAMSPAKPWTVAWIKYRLHRLKKRSCYLIIQALYPII